VSGVTAGIGGAACAAVSSRSPPRHRSGGSSRHHQHQRSVAMKMARIKIIAWRLAAACRGNLAAWQAAYRRQQQQRQLTPLHRINKHRQALAKASSWRSHQSMA